MTRRRTQRSYDVTFYAPAIAARLTDAGPGSAGGAETQIYLTARALGRNGARVSVIANANGLLSRSAFEGVDVVSLELPSHGPALLRKLRAVWALLRTVRDVDTRVLVARAAGPNIGVLAAAARISRTRFLYASANVIDFDFRRLSTGLHAALYRFGIRLANGIVVQTNEQAHLCRERFGRDATVIASISEVAPTTRRRPDAFLWAGRLAWYKRPLALLELARAMPEAAFRMVCVPVAGHEVLAEQVYAEARSVPNVDVLAPLPRRRLLELKGQAVAVVNTSDFEGMPNTFLEGWARGVPALALTHDPDGVIETHGLGAFAGGSFETFVKAAQDLWAHRDRQSEVARRCRNYVAVHHGADVVVAKWEEALGLAPSAANVSAVLREAASV
jgi:glycosyltransferase involved in cell wall biosynthesis